MSSAAVHDMNVEKDAHGEKSATLGQATRLQPATDQEQPPAADQAQPFRAGSNIASVLDVTAMRISHLRYTSRPRSVFESRRK